MKIVFPVLSLETGGGARFIYQLANGLVEGGHDVVIVIPHEGVIAWPLKAAVKRVNGLTPNTIPECDFVLPNFWPTVGPAWEAQKGKVVRLSLGYEPLWVPDPERAKQTYLIDAPVITISSYHRQLLLDHLGLDSEIIHGGVDTAIFTPREKASARTGKKRIFYILRSRTHGYFWKGNDEFSTACFTVRQKITELDIQIVTPEGVADGNTGLYTRNGMATDGIVTDEQLVQLYAESDIFVFNSRFEALGLPPLESMACGTAVITTDSGGSRDYAYDRENCLLIPPSDPGKLAEAMLELLSDDELRKRLAYNGHKFVQSWTWSRTTQKVENFLRSL